MLYKRDFYTLSFEKVPTVGGGGGGSQTKYVPPSRFYIAPPKLKCRRAT